MLKNLGTLSAKITGKTYEERLKELSLTISKGSLNLLKPATGRAERVNFFSVRVVDAWNKLPDKVKKADTTNTFKNRYDRYVSGQSIGDDGDNLAQ